MVSDKSNAEIRRPYSPAGVVTQKGCGQFATCSTCVFATGSICMYAAWPANYELTGYNLHCPYVNTGEEGRE